MAGQTFVEMDEAESRFIVTCDEEGVNCQITVS